MSAHPPLPQVIIVTGTDTGVGKTAVTSAIAALLARAGLSPAAYKPVQTGVAREEPGDMAVVERLAGIPTFEGCRLREPMAPRPAAAIEESPLPRLAEHVAAAERLRETHDHVLVEGAGGLLVELTDMGETLADLALALADAEVVVVARSALGTLNHTRLTLEALQRRQIRTLGVAIGSWPHQPSVIETTNRDYLAALPHGLLGALPAGAPKLPPLEFRAATSRWLPRLAVRGAAAPLGG